MDLNALSDLADSLGTLIEFAAGHRQRAIDAGFSPAAADDIGVQAHGFLMTTITVQATKK